MHSHYCLIFVTVIIVNNVNSVYLHLTFEEKDYHISRIPSKNRIRSKKYNKQLQIQTHTFIAKLSSVRCFERIEKEMQKCIEANTNKFLFLLCFSTGGCLVPGVSIVFLTRELCEGARVRFSRCVCLRAVAGTFINVSEGK